MVFFEFVPWRQPVVRSRPRQASWPEPESLREVPQMMPPRPQLLGVEPEMVSVAQHLLEEEPRLLDVPRAREALDVPEATDAERALVPGEAVGRGLAAPVAINEGIGDEILLEGAQRRQPAGVLRRDEPHERHQQARRVDGAGRLALDEGTQPGIPEVPEDVLVDRIPGAQPFLQRGREGTLPGQADGAIHGHPAHQARAEELPGAAANLPDALVGLLPVPAEPVDQAAEIRPQVV
jgi:hypothetical protein